MITHEFRRMALAQGFLSKVVLVEDETVRDAEHCDSASGSVADRIAGPQAGPVVAAPGQTN